VAQDMFVGIDGGGTKSKVRIEDSRGTLIGQAVGGPSNIRLSIDRAWQSIYQALDEALRPSGISLQDENYRFHVGMGLAGCEVPEIYDEFLNRSHPFATLQLTSDAHVACVGAHDAKDGAIIIIGTGVVGYQIQHGKTTRVSGWGFPHDDEGGGAWLGLEAARLTFQWLDHRIEKTPLVEDVYNFFNHDFEHFIAWANKANSSEFARLAPLVINHCQQEETLAIRLMKKAAHAIDRISVALEKVRDKSNEPFPVCLFGGIAPFVEPWLSEELRASLVVRKADANAGAILMVRDIAMKNRKIDTAHTT
jgi:glucosamine kinase